MKPIYVQKFSRIVWFVFIFLGAFILRYQYLAGVEFPLNDGGFFYQMTQELIENGFRLPEFTAYNHSQIPFAYPPFGLYLSGGISQLFNLDLLFVYQWLPLLLNLIALPFVFLLAEKLLDNFSAGLTAAALWGFAFPSYEYLIMGGGITRSPAYTASIISLFFYILHLRSDKKWQFAVAILFGGITALSHLEIFSVHIISILVLTFMEKKPKWKSAQKFSVYLLGCGLIASPYVIGVIKNHGLTPFLSASGSVDFSPAPAVVRLFLFNFPKEYSLTLTAVLAVVGISALILRRKPAFLIWFILMVLADPSNADRSALLPLALIAATGFHDVIIPALIRIKSERYNNGDGNPNQSIEFASFASIFLFLYVFFLAYFHFFTQENRWNSITVTDVQAFEWISNNTPADSSFLILPHKYSWQHDGVSEWFPALSKRKSLFTVQGAEWLPNDAHEQVERRYTSFHDCFDIKCNCLSETLRDIDIKPDYLWISKNEWPANTSACISPFIIGSTSDDLFLNVYENNDIILLSLK